MVALAPLHVNQRFLMERAARERPSGRVLDFGSGHGVAVDYGRSLGLDAWGTDLRERGSSAWFRRCEPDRLPFDDASFDVIVSNMVLEHVRELEAVLAEWHRVLRPDGTVLALWPVKGTWWEGHVRLPFPHRVSRRWYVAGLTLIGLGVPRRPGESALAFADRWLDYLATATHYRPLREYRRAFTDAGFTFEGIEHDYAAERWGWGPPFSGPVVRRLLTVAVRARRR